MKNLKMGQFQIRHLKTINWKIKQKKKSRKSTRQDKETEHRSNVPTT